VVYVRVASTDRADQEHGLTAQREACKREAKRLGAAIIEEFVDLGASASATERSPR
jgi:DNA invertase Pin-like site-specific DNA recombinase